MLRTFAHRLAARATGAGIGCLRLICHGFGALLPLQDYGLHAHDRGQAESLLLIAQIHASERLAEHV